MKMRLVILVSHPIQYCAPLYRELALRGNIDLHVVYLSDAGARTYYDESFNQTFSWDIPLLDGYAYTVLRPGLNLDGRGFLMRSAGRLEETLAGLTPGASPSNATTSLTAPWRPRSTSSATTGAGIERFMPPSPSVC